jgi:molecular chaperone HscB
MTDHYERLGLPRRFSIDEAELERRYLVQSREFHPDFHHGSTEAEQLAAVTLSAELNQAYTTLKDPYRRAEYLLSLLGGPVASQDKTMEPAFLMQMMEYRERLDELRAANLAATELETELLLEYQSAISELKQQFSQLESDPQPGSSALTAIRRKLNVTKTIISILREVQGTPDRS